MPALYPVLIAFFLAALVSFGINRFLILRADTLSLIDHPNHRSSHITPTPRGGGLGILLGFSAGTLITSLFFGFNPLIESVVLLGWVIAITGFYDDLVSAKASFRLLIQMGVMALLLAVIHFFSSPVQYQHQLVHIIVLVLGFFAGIWLMNLYNFMDGINGIAATETIFVLCIASACLAYQSIDTLVLTSMLVLIAACLGFLVWNFPRAQIFMGDAGSVFLGFILTAFALYTISNHQLRAVSWLIWLSVFWVDTTYTLLKRIFTKQNWHQAHRTHLYQILSRRLASHSKVVGLMMLYNIAWLLPLSLIGMKWSYLNLLCLFLSITPILIACVYFQAGKNNE